MDICLLSAHAMFLTKSNEKIDFYYILRLSLCVCEYIITRNIIPQEIQDLGVGRLTQTFPKFGA